MKKKNKFLSFWAFVIYALLIFVIFTCVAMNNLTDYLEEYESYQPTTQTDTVLTYFSEKDASALSLLPCPGDSLKGEIFKAYIDRFVNPDTLFCYKSSGTENTLVYDYISDNRKLASLTLALTGNKSKRGFDEYKVESITWYPLMKYSITAPESCTVYINGTDISESKAQAEIISNDTAFENFDGYKSSTVKYTIDYLEYITNVTAESNSKAIIVKTETVSDDGLTVDYNFAQEMSEVMKSEIELRARAASKAYIFYTTFHSIPVSTVLPYIHPDASLYNSLQHFDNTWSNTRYKDEFTKFDVSDYVYYSDDHASCRVSAILRVHKPTFSRDYNFDFDLYFVKEDNTWYLTSMERVNK